MDINGGNMEIEILQQQKEEITKEREKAKNQISELERQVSELKLRLKALDKKEIIVNNKILNAKK